MTSIARQPDNSEELEWCHSLLAAIAAMQQQLQPGSRHSDSINCILSRSLELTHSSGGMLANVVGGEPCRLTDVVPADVPREDTLVDFDRLARTAIDRKRAVFSDQDEGTAALPLSIGSVVHGVLVLSGAPLRWKPELVESMSPFTGTAAAVLRQFQEDLSAPQVDAVFDHLADGILTVDVEGRVESMNAAAEQMFGYSLDEVLEQSVRMLLPEPYASRHDENLEHYRRTGEIRIMGYGRELDGQRKDGTVFPLDISVSQIEIQGRDVFVVIARDITEHKAQQQLVELERANSQTLELLVRIDAVTGIANRRHFDEALTTEVRRAARDSKPVALVLCDIDFFKAFNDRYGHPAGDKALHAVAKAIESCFQRAGEVAARYGGEEFGIVIPGASLEQAAELAGKMHRTVAGLSIPHSASRVADHITLSIGIASAVPGPHFDQHRLVEEADRALYRAKGAGRNRIELARQ
ncbi:MAG: diguanylate cyclase [Gammaproteobacteria bacterium]|nr:diguanylate cyclase [Gammaproteobacteria bacterium]NNF59760.1 diguanylate cyclase [Gammaproteobacteria bacterium]NNM20954.1 diguanylate cyclase [Gammaproteobacteria bacterium]